MEVKVRTSARDSWRTTEGTCCDCSKHGTCYVLQALRGIGLDIYFSFDCPYGDQDRADDKDLIPETEKEQQGNIT